MLDKTDKALGEILEKLTKLAEVHGDQATQIAAQVVLGDAISNLIAGALIALVAVVGWRIGYLYWRKEPETSFDDPKFAAVLIYIGSALPTIASLVLIANYWTWVALFDPKLALAKELLRKVL